MQMDNERYDKENMPEEEIDLSAISASPKEITDVDLGERTLKSHDTSYTLDILSSLSFGTQANITQNSF